MRGIVGQAAHLEAGGFDPAALQIQERKVSLAHPGYHAQPEAARGGRRVELGHAGGVGRDAAHHLIVGAHELHRHPAQRLRGPDGIGENGGRAARRLLHNQADIGYGHQLVLPQPEPLGVLHPHHEQALARPAELQVLEAQVQQPQPALFGQRVH